MRGLTTNHCQHHHLTRLVAEAIDAKVRHVIIKLLEPTGGVMVVMRLETGAGLCDVNVDVAAGLSLTIHLGLLIFMDGDHAHTDSKYRASQGLTGAPTNVQIPEAFHQVMEGLDLHPLSDE